MVVPPRAGKDIPIGRFSPFRLSQKAGREQALPEGFWSAPAERSGDGLSIVSDKLQFVD